MGTRIKTFDSSGVAPGGRLFASDLNAIQDQYADIVNYAQNQGVGVLAIGEVGLQLLKYAAGEARLTGKFRTDGKITAGDDLEVVGTITQDGDAVATQDELTAAITAAKTALYPVGSIYISVVATNPGTLLGFGTWAAFATGRTLVGIDTGDTDFDTVEEIRGAKTVTLASGEMPVHTHTQNSHNHTQDAHQHEFAENFIPFNEGGGTQGSLQKQSMSGGTIVSRETTFTAATNQAATATNQNAGGGAAHNNIQPSIVVYMWKRTA